MISGQNVPGHKIPGHHVTSFSHRGHKVPSVKMFYVVKSVTIFRGLFDRDSYNIDNSLYHSIEKIPLLYIILNSYIYSID